MAKTFDDFCSGCNTVINVSKESLSPERTFKCNCGNIIHYQTAEELKEPVAVNSAKENRRYLLDYHTLPDGF